LVGGKGQLRRMRVDALANAMFVRKLDLRVEIVELVPGAEGVSLRQPFATGTAYQRSRLRIVVTCPTTSASTPFLNCWVLTEPPG
jgi:hypothetical protein